MSLSGFHGFVLALTGLSVVASTASLVDVRNQTPGTFNLHHLNINVNLTPMGGSETLQAGIHAFPTGDLATLRGGTDPSSVVVPSPLSVVSEPPSVVNPYTLQINIDPLALTRPSVPLINIDPASPIDPNASFVIFGLPQGTPTPALHEAGWTAAVIPRADIPIGNVTPPNPLPGIPVLNVTPQVFPSNLESAHFEATPGHISDPMVVSETKSGQALDPTSGASTRPDDLSEQPASHETFSGGNLTVKELIWNLEHVRHINYAELQRANFGVFVDQVWTLYELYFPPEGAAEPETPSPSATPGPVVTPLPLPVPTPHPISTPTPATLSYESERHTFYLIFLSAFLWGLGRSVAEGIIGNLAYDLLKSGFAKRTSATGGSVADRYAKLLQDIERFVERLRAAERERLGVNARDMATTTNIPVEVARVLLKLFGWAHSSNCSWYPT